MMIYLQLAMPGKQAKILSLDDVNDPAPGIPSATG